MSKVITVLTPNGRRINVNCNPDTSIGEVLENVCQKQGLQAIDFDLKHHNTVLDLTNTIRFANLPNKAFLEMIDAERRRIETNVTIGLTLEDGERRTGEFPPCTHVYDLVSALAAQELNCMENPAVVYMRQEVIGIHAMKQKTLKHLGLIGGRAVIRLLNKSEQPQQANVSAVYRAKPQPEPEPSKQPTEKPKPNTAKTFDPVLAIRDTLKKEEHKPEEHKPESRQEKENLPETRGVSRNFGGGIVIKDSPQVKMDVDSEVSQPNSTPSSTQEDLERRLLIEEEVSYVGPQKAIVYKLPETQSQEIEDLPDDFYDLTVEEVRQLYRKLQQERTEAENAPLLTSSKREAMEKEASLATMRHYNNAVVRIQFPDSMILQGVFTPTDTVQDIMEFVKSSLQEPHKQFSLFTTPLETLNPMLTLTESKFVPCVHMHFKWSGDSPHQGPFLKPEFYSNTTPSDAANILASKFRAPTRNKTDEASTSKQGKRAGSGTSKVPKWFKK